MTRVLGTNLVAVLLFLAAAVPVGAQPPPLEGTEWGPQEQGPAEQFVGFGGDGQLSGSGGCNRFTGTWEREDARLSIGLLATTRMMCAPAVMDAERAFLTALDDVRGIASLDPLVMVLEGEGGETVLRLQRRDVN